MAGLTSTGFQKKTLQEIKSEIEESLRSIFGPFINLLPGSVFATIVGIFAERESAIWDQMEEVYWAMYPDSAEGVNLDNAVAFNGVTRLGAKKSTIADFFLFGTNGTLIPLGTIFSVDGNPSARFQTDNDVTLTSGLNARQDITFSNIPDAGNFTLAYRGQTTAAIPYTADSLAVKNALEALSTIDLVNVTGNFSSGFNVEFDGENGLQPQELLEAVSFLTQGGGAVDVAVSNDQVGESQGTVNLTALEDGPIDAPLYTLTVIDTPVSGLTGAVNTTAAVLGRNIETDAELRIRRASTLSITGAATVEALRSRLLNLPGVTSVGVFENDSLFPDGGGRPGKSFEAVVGGGDDQEIADTIWIAKPAGIKPHGDISVDVVDSLGEIRVIRFSRPGDVAIYLSLDITKDDTFPTNGAAVVQATIIEWGNSLGVGKDVIVYPQLVGALKDIPGILDIRVRIGTSAVSNTPNDPAQDDNIVVDADEVAEFAEARTTVNIL